MSLQDMLPTPSKTDNGTHDSTCNEMKTSKILSMLSSDTGSLEHYDTSLSEDPRSEQDHNKTITRSGTSMSRPCSTIASASAQSCNIGVSRLETVIILFRGTELCLCPDGEIIIQKHSPRLIPDSVFYMKWGHSLLTKHQLAKRSQSDRKRKRSGKLMKSSSTCED